MRTYVTGSFIFLFTLAAYANGYGKYERTPFHDVRVKKHGIFVEVSKKTYKLEKLDSIPAKEILEFCLTRYHKNCEQVFSENLSWLLETMGLELKAKNILTLIDLKTTSSIILPDVPATRDKRAKLLKKRKKRLQADKKNQKLNSKQKS